MKNENLYIGTIGEYVNLYCMEFIEGNLDISSIEYNEYETVLSESNGNYTDINKPNRIINIEEEKTLNYPKVSYNHNLYMLNIESLKEYNENIEINNAKVKKLR